ncbi:MAG TPA: ATP-sensitive inward rectifier potassium channel 10, partial [Myxococcales bacterium]|nr:ATP-sensitive inward rectifier potassium channel 10 [Myxococcales bacterium]
MQRRPPKKKKRRDPVREFENTVTRLGEETRFWNDTYVQLLRMKWRYLLLFFILIFLFFNAMFAFAYLSIEGSINKAQPGSFLDAFFFSVQTSTTIGYGGMTPNGLVANVLVTVEALTALLGFAVATGLVFAKFSRPTGRILYSDRALITKRNGVPCFVFRLTNERQ